jgi:hypothetical protein
LPFRKETRIVLKSRRCRYVVFPKRKQYHVAAISVASFVGSRVCKIDRGIYVFVMTVFWIGVCASGISLGFLLASLALEAGLLDSDIAQDAAWSSVVLKLENMWSE